MVKNSFQHLSLFLIHARKLAGLKPLVGEAEFGDPFFDVREVELASTNFQDTGCIFNLPR